MYLNFDENRPDTPRVPTTFTKLERVLLAIVTYQALMLVYFLAPDSWLASPVKQLIAPDEPMRYVHIEPLVDRTAIPKKIAPPSDLDRRSTSPEPIPQARNEDPVSRGPTPDRVVGGPPEAPRAAETPQRATGQSANDAVVQRKVPGGILGNALRNMQQYVQTQSGDNPEGGAGENGSDVQFDSKGIDFGPWLRR